MKRLAFATLMIILSSPSLASLQPGAQAPDFTAKAWQAGREFSFSMKEALKKGPVVIYFHEGAYLTFGYLKNRRFAEQSQEFEALGATVVGVSLDSIETLKEASADPKVAAGKIPMVSDVGGTIAKKFQVTVEPGWKDHKGVGGREGSHDRARAVTFVVNTNGKIVTTIENAVVPEHLSRALEEVVRMADALIKLTGGPRPAGSKKGVASKPAPPADCLKQGLTPPSPNTTYFTVRNDCGERMIVFYCLIYDKPPTLSAEEDQGLDCRHERDQRVMVSGNGRAIMHRAPRSLAEYHEASRANQLYMEPGALWESHEMAERSGEIGGVNADIFMHACRLSEYLGGECTPSAIEWWRMRGSPQLSR